MLALDAPVKPVAMVNAFLGFFVLPLRRVVRTAILVTESVRCHAFTLSLTHETPFDRHRLLYTLARLSLCNLLHYNS